MQTMASVSHCHESLSGHLACSMIVRDANPNRNYLPLPRDAGGFREYRRLDGANVFDLLAGPALMCSLMRTSGCVWPFAISMVWRIFRIRRRAIVLRLKFFKKSGPTDPLGRPLARVDRTGTGVYNFFTSGFGEARPERVGFSCFFPF